MDPAQLLSAMKRTVEQLAAFNDIAKALTSTLEVREVLEVVMQKVSELLRPRNWSLLLEDERTGSLYFEIAVGEGADRLKTLTVLPGEGIAGAVFSSGTARCVDEVHHDPKFTRRFDDASRFVTRSVLAVPLMVRGRALGVIELVNGAGDPPFTDDDLRVVTGIADFAAIAIDNARNFRRIQELTLTDEHTGLYNMRHLRALLQTEVERAKRFKHPLSLLFIDLDHFKRVNDTHGHLVGSAVLKEVGELLSRCVRQIDSAFRYGGDEFAVLLVETDVDSSRVVGERIVERFREHVFQKERGLALKVTCSVGLATFPDHAQGAMELLQAADREMYRVKSTGRNGLLAAHDAEPPSSAATRAGPTR
jgi:diguanylate cyclase (GGDEF)-like protein